MIDRTVTRVIGVVHRKMACGSEIDMILAIPKCIGRILGLGANYVVEIALVVLTESDRGHNPVPCLLARSVPSIIPIPCRQSLLLLQIISRRGSSP
ncbi:unnamed protein product [Danaus chrysippus]|uniref:(African queen) hypothetical protein n=1 Tax=Danaus chrysippus TaxID=151541 RepID=A0A8J2RCY3_9NEOP|nr:unnamed protein product [Danaus chrysippus]